MPRRPRTHHYHVYVVELDDRGWNHARFRAAPESVDVVITDYSMARLSGLEVVRRMREAAPGVPAILLTGFVEELPPETLAAAGIQRMLRKPVSTAELAGALADLLRRG